MMCFFSFDRISSAPSPVVQTRWVPPERSVSVQLTDTALLVQAAITSSSGKATFIARLTERCRKLAGAAAIGKHKLRLDARGNECPMLTIRLREFQEA